MLRIREGVKHMVHALAACIPFLAALGYLSAFSVVADAQLASDSQGVSVRNSVGMEMIRIPAGEFIMGSYESGEAIKKVFPNDEHDANYFNDELPQHRVRITRPFLMGKTEVTVGQFRQFAEETGYRTESELDGTGGWGFNQKKRMCEGRSTEYDWRSPGWDQTDDHPVLNVTFQDVNRYCQWLSAKTKQTYRLPTEAEWEYACRAGSTNRYSGFNDPQELCSKSRTIDVLKNPKFAHIQDLEIPEDGSIAFTAKVASYPPNAWGLHDMHGNVWEWTGDWHDDNYYAVSPTDDPQGPETGITRVRRGGAWNSAPLWSRASFRNWNSEDTRCSNLGFRVVAEISRLEEGVTMLFGGDVMLDGDPGNAVNHGIDPFVEFATDFGSVDIAVCNLECVISDKGQMEHKNYVFHGPEKALPILKKHFTAVSLANNHSMDYGVEGLVGEMEKLEAAQIPYFGGGRNLHTARQPLILNRNGFRVALLGYNGFGTEHYEATATTPGVAPLRIEIIEQDIKASREKYKADFVVPYVHWGPELVASPYEWQRKMARQMIDAGASAVIGAHPHVTQTVETYRGKPIVYSLGNLVFDYSPGDPQVWTGWLAKLSLGKSGDVDLELTSFEIDHQGIPRKSKD
jgi:formylglycine-generating enzyme required for sulfatase activity